MMYTACTNTVRDPAPADSLAGTKDTLTQHSDTSQSGTKGSAGINICSVSWRSLLAREQWSRGRFWWGLLGPVTASYGFCGTLDPIACKDNRKTI